MNKQEIFNKVFLGLKEQGFVQSMGTGESCAYRGLNGLKCAVGQLIPDELYVPAWDKQVSTVTDLPNDLFEKIGIQIDDDMLNFLSELQERHDYTTSPEDMQKSLEFFAKDNGLEVPE